MDMTLLQAAAQAVADSVHDGELSADAVGAISIMAGGLSRMIAPLLAQSEKVQRLLAILASAIAMGLWAYSKHAYSREGLFGMVEAFCTVAAATLGVFTLSDPRNYTRENLSDLTHTVTLGRAGTAAP